MKSTSSFWQRVARYGAVALIAMAAAACKKDAPGAGDTGADAGSPVEGDWVVIHELADAETLNLITANDATSQNLHNLMYETLTSTHPVSLEPIPWIADSLPVMSEDKLSYEFVLNKNAKFSDGKPVTADDFIFYLKAIKNPNIPNALPLRGYYSRVDRLEKVNNDPYRLRAVMTEPYYLAASFLGQLYAFPKHIWDPNGASDKITFEELNKNDPNKNPAIKEMAAFIDDAAKGFDKKFLVSSGRYIFEEHRRNDRIVLARNPNYWKKGDKLAMTYPDKLVYRTINDPNAAMAALKSGELDWYPIIEKVNFNNERQKFANYNVKEALYDYPAYAYIGYNQDNPIFKDKLVRQALSHALNRDQIIEKIYFGMARPVQSPIFYKRPEADTTIPIIKYDIAKSKALLAQAGWADSDGNGILDKTIDGKKTDFRFKILLNSGNRRREQIALIFVDELKKLGIDAGTTSLEWATFLDRTRDGEYEAMIAGWALNPVEGDMYQIWHSSSAEKGGSNHVRYRSPEVDKLIEQIRSEFDFNKRKDMYKQIQKIINEDQPYTFLVAEKQTGAYHNRFQNVQFYAPRPCYDAGEWWVPLSAQKYKTEKAVAQK